MSMQVDEALQGTLHLGPLSCPTVEVPVGGGEGLLLHQLHQHHLQGHLQELPSPAYGEPAEGVDRRVAASMTDFRRIWYCCNPACGRSNWTEAGDICGQPGCRTKRNRARRSGGRSKGPAATHRPHHHLHQHLCQHHHQLPA